MLKAIEPVLAADRTPMWPFSMNNKKLVKAWQAKIIDKAELRLRRELTDTERTLITSRGGFIALEMIEDTVDDLVGDELVEYLNAEAGEGRYKG